jgi:hypothetical protein
VRRITHRYVAPLDQLWIDCLGALGLTLKREAGAYATTDGKGTLTIAIDAELDPDDCLAQMIFHELCHAAVQGPESLKQRDWGLDNESDHDEVREHATLRVQAYLLRPLGLRTFLGPTTDFRAYYDALPEDPLAGDDPAILLARIALGRMRRAPFSPAVGHALAATASMIEATAAFAELASVHAQPRVRAPEPSALPSLVETALPRAPFHAAGVAMPAASSIAASQTCGTCTWFGAPSARDRKTARCVSTDAKVRSELSACERWEPMPACETCGACCREAFHVLYLSAREPFVKKHPELVVLREGQRELQRPGGRCPPLRGDGVSEPYRCAVHDDRPKTCREFEQGGANCLEARRRVGLSV